MFENNYTGSEFFFLVGLDVNVKITNAFLFLEYVAKGKSIIVNCFDFRSVEKSNDLFTFLEKNSIVSNRFFAFYCLDLRQSIINALSYFS